MRTRDELEYRLREILNDMDRDRMADLLSSDAVGLSGSWSLVAGLGAPDVLKTNDVLYDMVLEHFSESLLRKSSRSLRALVKEASRPRRLPSIAVRQGAASDREDTPNAICM